MAINIKKQIQYWQKGAYDNIDTARYLIDGGKRLEGLFFCHLAVEKILKAHVVKTTKKIPPYIHNLRKLGKLAGLEFDEASLELFGQMMNYQIEGRYQDALQKPPGKAECNKLVNLCEEHVKCLAMKLKK